MVRAADFFKVALNFDQHSSIGEKSGEYGGKKRMFCPAFLKAWAMESILWQAKLSISTIWFGSNSGINISWTYTKKASPVILPFNSKWANSLFEDKADIHVYFSLCLGRVRFASYTRSSGKALP